MGFIGDNGSSHLDFICIIIYTILHSKIPTLSHVFLIFAEYVAVFPSGIHLERPLAVVKYERGRN
jgi:hypothetical protein